MSVCFKKEGVIGRIILNNPEKHNAFDEAMIEDLLHILETIEQDSNLRVIILSAEGPSFSAGADLNWMKKMANYSEEDNYNDALKLARLMQKLNALSKPTIALVQGDAYGGALGLIACCDVVFSTSHAHFCFSEVKLGLIPAVISPYVIAAIGERMARRYFITAERFSAEEALRIRLIHEISENLAADGLKLATQIANNGPLAIQCIKGLIQEVKLCGTNEKILNKTALEIAKIRVSLEGQEGISAFLAKRKAAFHLKCNGDR